MTNQSNALEAGGTDLRCGSLAVADTTSLVLLTSLATQVGGVLDHPAMRPDPVMDLVMLVAIMLGAIMLFLLLWLLVRKYGAAPVVEPPRGEEILVDGASTHRRASKTSSQQRLPVGAGADRPRGAVPSSAPERGLPDAARGTSAAIGRAVPQGLSSGPDMVPRPGAECSGTTDFPATSDKRLKKDGAKAAVAAPVAKHARDAAAGAKRRGSSRRESRDSTAVQKPKASSGWLVAVEGCKAPEPSSGKESAEDADAATTGTGKRPSYDEEQDTAGIGRASGGQAADQAAHEEHSAMASAEQTTTKEHRRHKKKSKKQQREGSGRGSANTASPPEAGAEADTTTTRRKRKSRRGKDSKPFTSAADGFVNSGLSSPDEERSKPATLVPKSQMSTRRSSTKSKTSRKSGKSEDAKSDAAASPPAGWTIAQAPDDGVVVARAPATADAHIADDDFCLPELSDLGGKEFEPPTPMHPNLDIYSREHSSMAYVEPPVGAALVVEGLSGERTPNVASTLSDAPALSGVREAPTPMKPNLDVFSRERSPYGPASPHKPPTPPP